MHDAGSSSQKLWRFEGLVNEAPDVGEGKFGPEAFESCGAKLSDVCLGLGPDPVSTEVPLDEASGGRSGRDYEQLCVEGTTSPDNRWIRHPPKVASTESESDPQPQ